MLSVSSRRFDISQSSPPLTPNDSTLVPRRRKGVHLTSLSVSLPAGWILLHELMTCALGFRK